MSNATAAEALDPMLCFAVYSVERQFGQIYRELLAPWKLSYTQYLALIALYGDDDLTVGRLGELLGLDSGTLSPLLKRLESRGLVERRRAASDERVVEISLTDAGRELYGRLDDIPRCFGDRTGLEHDEYLQLLSLAKTLSARMRGEDHPQDHPQGKGK
ncbi:MarR family winged helix-turn-helix transcriptional regulator [Gryllotalpicola protaetiae]|uniref:MarR family transcriptional regulator n=1 Tax=Gryllotalpicola protaetiae TaxID=2419771 RepID=A0A387BMM6_9MICO|nr:MarR family transcriptional regulator [Gryllotalpicola protaetiae]AYG02270.1 MarR family transcriptional regulator [Gryllotalpicola protaetiae]